MNIDSNTNLHSIAPSIERNKELLADWAIRQSNTDKTMAAHLSGTPDDALIGWFRHSKDVREQKPLNTGHNHPCASAELGEFITHITFNAAPDGEPADWQVRFNYMHGYVVMRVEQNNYKYVTTMYH